MRTVDTDVLVVGAGPAGLTASALLARQRVDAITISRHPGTAHSPRAHITNQRTAEVFRDLGLEPRLRAVATPNHLMGNNVWATSLAGEEIARLKSWGTGVDRAADYAAASPCAMCNAPQHLLEPVLLEGAAENGADVRFSTELIDIAQTEDAVVARVRERTAGAEYTIRARYAIGADGGRSLVADRAGFALDGEMGLGAALNMWLEVDLSRYTAHRPGVLYWTAQPGNNYWVGSGTWICVRPWTEWVLLCMYDPTEGEPDLSEPAVVERARASIGDPDVDVRVKDVSKWQINRVVATEYRRGRIFLAGDAAHRHPPANGLGTNTSIQDSFNLAWKLGMVLRGRAGEGLLDTYDAERRPVGRAVVDRAMRSVRDMRPIPDALGFYPGQTSEDGWAALHELFSDAEGAADRRRALDEAIALQNYQFNAHGVELGQQYSSDAVVDDGTPLPEPLRDPELYHQPTTHPGAPLPHAWIQRGAQQISTLDLAGGDRFALIVGSGGGPWVAAASAIARETGIDLPVRTVDYRGEYHDVLGRWRRLREVGDDGALLVRPDRHIAWRSFDMPESPRDALRAALLQVLSRGEAPTERAGRADAYPNQLVSTGTVPDRSPTEHPGAKR
ncbi:FAD-dependent oxidoreductase [Saccharopolyspora griseoalba]|uniref:FAD-dependent oxidoreductase n=1 Tax=Saccharopolyspora griseoalba TaxID=1431848 RepID=A0ABW2LRD6_9PSEU